MTTFTDKDGNILDPQPSLSDVLRDRIAHAQLTLVSNADSEQLKQALELLVEINKLIINAQTFQSLEELSRYIEASPNVMRLVNDPRDIFQLLIYKGSPYAFFLFEWVDYQNTAKNWRPKIWLDVRGKNGKEEYCVWPNADRIGSFHTNDIEAIRISKKSCPGEEDWKHVLDRKPGDDNYVDLKSNKRLL